jgi:hypothetical protein
MFVSFYTILKQRLNIFWSSTPTNFSYEPPLPRYMSTSSKGPNSVCFYSHPVYLKMDIELITKMLNFKETQMMHKHHNNRN